MKRALVTGGVGFLGSAIARELLQAGHSVTVLSRTANAGNCVPGASAVAMDLGDADGLARAIECHDTVFHVAAKAGFWGPKREYHAANVIGTRHVLEACTRAGVERLVYTSSPSVCFDGGDHIRAGNDLPYATRSSCAYPITKALAEREVLAANGRGGIATCALRPHLIFGPGDPHLIPRLVQRAARGKLAVVGDGKNEVSMTFIENAAWAHICAARELAPAAPHAGKAYFIAQEDPVRLWDWIAELLRRLDIKPIERKFSRSTATAIGALAELLWRLLPLAGEPPMTRFVAAQLASSHSYDMGPARRDFGYRERWSTEAATERTIAHLLEQGRSRRS